MIKLWLTEVEIERIEVTSPGLRVQHSVMLIINAWGCIDSDLGLSLIFGFFKVQYVKVYESLFGKTLDRFKL